MREYILSVLTSAGTGVLLLAALAWLLRSWISQRLTNAIRHEYDDRLESHKAQLKADNDKEIARLNFQFTQTTIEHQVRFAGLYAKRADVISTTYSRLIKAQRLAHSFASPVQYSDGISAQVRYGKTLEALAEFFDYFDENQLWLPTSVCEKINPLVDGMRSKTVMYGVFRDLRDEEMGADLRQRKDEAWRAAWKYFSEEVPAARTALEDELRSLLAGPN